jgi:hypothetical protein
VRLFENFGIENSRLRNRLVKPAHLKPEEHAEPVRCCVGVAEVGMSVRIPRMKLQDDFPISNYLLVFRSAVPALAIE